MYVFLFLKDLCVFVIFVDKEDKVVGDTTAHGDR